MCKKLMFLVSFVALLGLVNIVSADTWLGGTSDWCDPANWEDGSVPAGEDDDAELPDTDNDPLIQGPACSADFGLLVWDIGSSESVTLFIVDAEVRFKEGDESGDGVETLDISGTSNVDCWDDRIRWGNHSYGILNMMSGSPVLHINGDLRGGDEDDGMFDLNMSGGVLDVEGEILCGDDGSGVLTFTGGDVVCERFTMAARKGGQTADLVISNTEIYIGDGDDPELRLGKDCKEDGGDYGGIATMTMTSGTVNAGKVLLSVSEDACADVVVDIQGGLLVVRDELIVGDGDGAVSVSLSGGEIRIESGDSLEIDNGQVMDICGGVLKIKGNVIADIMEMVCDGSGRLTGCGSPAGVNVEFDGVYTVVTDTVADPDKAYCPEPANGADRVQSVITEVVLCWQPGAGIGSRGRHIVYFGSDCDAVENAGPGDPENVCVNRADVLCCNVGNLPLWQCYCWRVDEFNENGTTTTGDLWTFCTGCADIPGDHNRDCLVNFIDYAHVVDDFGETLYWP